MKHPIISIISPVYKTEAYLERLITSVINQSYPNFELILVNDGSPDRSGEICNEFAAKDSRIRVIHKENGGVSSARNVGLDAIRGDWCCFIDSDDSLYCDYLLNFMENIHEGDDLIMQGFTIHYEKNDRSIDTILDDCQIYSRNRIVQYLERTKGVHNGFIWHRLFKSSIISDNKIRFQEGISFAEDGWFFLSYMKYADKCSVTSKLGYIYEVREGTLTSLGRETDTKTLIRVFEGFMDNVISYDVPMSEVDSHLEFCKVYGWRLAESWFWNRGYKKRDLDAIRYIEIMLEKYSMDKAKKLSLILRLLVRAHRSRLRAIIVPIILRIRSLEKRIL